MKSTSTDLELPVTFFKGISITVGGIQALSVSGNNIGNNSTKGTQTIYSTYT
jgi:hypothetical protein